MTYGDVNSGAVPQPGGVVYRPDMDKTPIEETEAATKAALAGEPPFDNAQAGAGTDPAQTPLVVEADDIEASGTPSPAPEESGDDGDEDEDESKPPAKSASKAEWADYAGLSEEEADAMTKEEIIAQYGA